MITSTPADRARRLGPRVGVSSFSLRADLGEIRVEAETPDGGTTEVVLPSAGTLGLGDFIRRVRHDLDVDAVEICQFQINDTSPDTLTGLRDALDHHGVQLTTLPIDIGNIANPDPSRRERYLAEIRTWIDIAARLGATFARVNAGAAVGAANSSRIALVASLQALADHAASVDIGLLVENHGGLSSDPEWLLDLFDSVGSERVGLILDTGNFEPMLALSHARFAGQRMTEDGVDFQPVYDGIARLAPLATVVHAKAFDVHTDGTTTPLDLRRSLQIIQQAGFDGPITVEYESDQDDPWGKTAQVVAQVRETFDRIGPTAAPSPTLVEHSPRT